MKSFNGKKKTDLWNLWMNTLSAIAHKSMPKWTESPDEVKCQLVTYRNKRNDYDLGFACDHDLTVKRGREITGNKLFNNSNTNNNRNNNNNNRLSFLWHFCVNPVGPLKLENFSCLPTGTRNPNPTCSGWKRTLVSWWGKLKPQTRTTGVGEWLGERVSGDGGRFYTSSPPSPHTGVQAHGHCHSRLPHERGGVRDPQGWGSL